MLQISQYPTSSYKTEAYKQKHTVLTQKQMHKAKEQNRRSRNKPCNYSHLRFKKGEEICQRKEHPQQMMLGKLDIHMQKTEDRAPLSCIKIYSK